MGTIKLKKFLRAARDCSQTTLVSGSPFLLPLNGEELPTGNDLSQTPWGRAKNFRSLLLFFLVYRFFSSKLEN